MTTGAVVDSIWFTPNYISYRYTFNKAGHLISRREPNGNLTQYEYDLLDRRKKQINPANEVWETLYTKPIGSAPAVTQTYPGLNTANTAYQVTRQMDRAGRLIGINYNDPATTPNVAMTYNPAGRRLSMVETGSGSTTIRKTEFGYDSALRLTQARFDIDGHGVFEQIVNYGYDGGGVRTSLQLAHDGNKTVYYNHDAKGRLIAFTDWSSQETVFDYTNADRLKQVTRATDLNSSHAYDPSGRLLQLRHYSGTNTIVAQFDYPVNALGNRTQVVEEIMPAGGGALQPQTIKYTYDAVSRLKSATYYPNLSGTGTPSTYYGYTYDRAGNRLTETLNAQTKTFTYNNRNQLTGDGAHTYTYDMNGNLLRKALGGTPVESDVWNRANRLASMGGHTYTYGGDGSRVSQTVSGMTIRYLQDVQSPLPVVLSETAGGLVTRYVHGPTGIHMQQNPNGTWQSMMQDGLGSMRGVYSGGVISPQKYSSTTF